MRETSCRSVGPTARLSMLKPRRANMLVTRISAPGLFSTRTDSVCFMRIHATRLQCNLVAACGCSCLHRSLFGHFHDVECRRPCGNHREAMLARIDARVHHAGASGGKRLFQCRLQLLVVLDRVAETAVRTPER